MSADVKKRFIILGIVVLISLLFLYPTAKIVVKSLSGQTLTTEDTVGGSWISQPIALGLDLSGGVHLVYEVQVQEAVKSRLQSYAAGIRAELRDAKIAVKKASVTSNDVLELTLLSDRNIEKVEEVVRENYRDLAPQGRREENGTPVLSFGISEGRAADIKRAAVADAVERLRNRVDQFGVREPLIQQVGEYRIMLQMPGVHDIEAVKRIVGRVAKLEFRFLPRGGASDTGTIKLKNRQGDPVVVEDQVQMTGDVVKDAGTGMDNIGRTEVMLEFTSEGARRFAKVSGENVGRQLAIILDNVVYSEPEIKDRIAGGRASITGNFSMQEANELATVLRSGALPAPLTVMEESLVGPTLGRESIIAGMLAVLLGFGFVLIFMCIYYKKAGAVACFILFLNLFFLLAALSAFGATLTLPGIAGLALTLGMAVDSNVIIFERIRDELRIGASRDASVEAGFHKALSAIMDSNLTTLLSGVILYYFGTGSVRGFAVTLNIGIVTTVFCATFVARLLFDYLPLTSGKRELSI